MWIGIDDTDSPNGGCTTWVLSELLAEASHHHIDLIGEPRLVRLNPNVPWKTRGNAALAARFGTGAGPKRRIGAVEGRAVWSYSRAQPGVPRRSAEWLDAAWTRVLAGSRVGEPGTDPALVAVERMLPAALYWNAVREVVEVSDVDAVLAREGAFVRVSGSRRGIVGASAAIAWREHRCTWELIAYRRPEHWSRPRDVDAESVRRAQANHPRLFLCDDRRTRRLLVAPHTPCPILFGLRGTGPSDPLAARKAVVSEPVDRWVLFRTNQGSGDHLVQRTASGVGEYESGRVLGTVVATPEVLRGGHVRFSIVDPSGVEIECVAFEPTKTLPDVARSLASGDRVRVWGSRSRDPSLHVEGLELLRLAARRGATAPPRCERCHRSARSLGRQRGYRCAGCRRRWPPEAGRVRISAPRFGVGTYHPTPSARRHLAPRGPEP